MSCTEEKKIENPYKPPRMEGADKNESLRFRLGPEVTKHIRWFLQSRGWQAYEYDWSDEDSMEKNGKWHLDWRDKKSKISIVRNLRPDQRLNHILDTFPIIRKDMLTINYMNLAKAYPDAYNFHPQTYLFSSPEEPEFERFMAAYRARAVKGEEMKAQGVDDGSENNYWISKPAAGHRGKGIFVFDDINTLLVNLPINQKITASGKVIGTSTKRASINPAGLSPNKSVVVQEYITNAMCLHGYKFDIRMYVFTPSCWPPRIYLFDQVVGRLATTKYNRADLDDVFSHLTNSSINKKNKTVWTEEEKKILGRGAKWTRKEMFDYLEKDGYNTDEIWKQIQRLVILTTLLTVGVTTKQDRCYECLGFDIMLDTNGKPWLIEVNRSPAMAVGCECDRVKTAMLTDMFNLLDLENGLLNGHEGEWPDMNRDPGNFERLFPFDNATQAANEQLAARGDGPSLASVSKTGYNQVKNLRVWSETEGEEDELFFIGESAKKKATTANDEKKPLKPWKNATFQTVERECPPPLAAAREFRRTVIPLVNEHYKQTSPFRRVKASAPEEASEDC